MTTVKPSNYQLTIDLPSGGKLKTNLIQLAGWVHGMRIEVNTGLQLTRGRSLSAKLKDSLEIPKSARKTRVLAIVEDIKRQADKQFQTQ